MQAKTALDHWKSSFGDDYTKRNEINGIARLDLWEEILPRESTSILEVGANRGGNLHAIRFISGADLFACEPNDLARHKLASESDYEIAGITADTADNLSHASNSIEIVFTSGVLIHVPPDKLEQSMREIHRVSRRWIICGEYFAPQEEEIKYRGHDGLMWRRDYGSLYMDLFPDLKCTKTLFAWKRTTGLDNLTFWVFEKQ